MADQAVKDHIRDELRNACFNRPDDYIDVSDGDGDNIHLVVVSRRFDGRRAREMTDLVWSILTEKTSRDEWGRISLVSTASPEDLKAL